MIIMMIARRINSFFFLLSSLREWRREKHRTQFMLLESKCSRTHAFLHLPLAHCSVQFSSMSSVCHSRAETPFEFELLFADSAHSRVNLCKKHNEFLFQANRIVGSRLGSVEVLLIRQCRILCDCNRSRRPINSPTDCLNLFLRFDYILCQSIRWEHRK